MGHLTIKVKPGSKQPEIKIIDSQGMDKSHRSDMANEPTLLVRLCEPADKNKANLALIKLLSRLSGFQVRICAGASNKVKVIEFDTDVDTFLKKVMQNTSG